MDFQRNIFYKNQDLSTVTDLGKLRWMRDEGIVKQTDSQQNLQSQADLLQLKNLTNN